MARDGRPNILWISFEDTSPRYGCYGDPVARTPELDRLADQGCRWANAFSTCGVCAPARSAIITGMYATSIGTHHMRTRHVNNYCPELPTPYGAVVPHYVRCFTEYLRAAGYYCTNNAKTDYQFESPFTAWDELGPKAHWRNRPDLRQPFFAVFNLTHSHESGMWPENCPEPSFDPADMEVPPYFPDTPKVRDALARMYTHIAYNDCRLGDLLAQLEVDGLADNTVVFHWSDHGPLPRGKRWPYDAGIHVPMLVRWPGHLPSGGVEESLVSTVDLGPTVLSVAGLDVPLHMQGRAFLGNQTDPERDYVYASRDRHDEAYDMVRAVRDRRFKYIRNFRPELPYLLWIPYHNRHPIVEEMWRLHLADELTGPEKLLFQPGRPAEELYDIYQDPHEIHNLVTDPAYGGEVERLRKALAQWRCEVGDMGEIDEVDMVGRWYPDGVQPQTSTPLFVPFDARSAGQAIADPLCELTTPAMVQLYCSTQGASIGFTMEKAQEALWCLYTEPLRLEVGETRIRARAARLGYRESEEQAVVFRVRSEA